MTFDLQSLIYTGSWITQVKYARFETFELNRVYINITSIQPLIPPICSSLILPFSEKYFVSSKKKIEGKTEEQCMTPSPA